MSDGKVLAITYSEVILAIVRLWKAEVIETSHMVCSSNVSKPMLVLCDTSIRSCDHCCKFGRRVFALICIIYAMTAING